MEDTTGFSWCSGAPIPVQRCERPLAAARVAPHPYNPPSEKGDVMQSSVLARVRRATVRTALAFLVGLTTTLALGIAPASAQLTTGTIAGTVKDNTGGALPGAEVTITNVNTGITRTLFTNEHGRYEAASLPVGTYDVTAAMQGFTTRANKGLEITVGRNAVIDFTLELGGIQ
jgi:hypothetical protein